VEFDFDDACQNTLESLKSHLIEAPVLTHYNPTRQSRLETDASDSVVAGVLSQLGDNQFWHPVVFFSKTMAPAELNYKIHDKEMLAIWSSPLANSGIGQFDPLNSPITRSIRKRILIGQDYLRTERRSLHFYYKTPAFLNICTKHPHF
jgi:hypothetical protein